MKVRVNVNFPLSTICVTGMSEFFWLVVSELGAQTKKEKSKKQANRNKVCVKNC